jgi:DNA-binding transcriptional MocR family regulator
MDDALVRRWNASGKIPERIAACFARKMASGEISEWEPLPDNEETADDYGVSVSTVLRAKKILAENGAAEKHDGVYVRRPNP